MRSAAPFRADDLAELDDLLALAATVVPMRDVAAGNTNRHVIGLRHDVDNNDGSLDTALRMAAWEQTRGYRSTYFLLHGSRYWQDVGPAAKELERLGHEVGLHVNAVAEALRTGRDAVEILTQALAELRTAAAVTGCVAHGDGLCRVAGFVNDELFVECERPDWGETGRTVTYQGATATLHAVSRADLGLTYDSSWLSRDSYLSDSGGKWQNGYSTTAFDETLDGFPFDGQLHMLVHPDWWAQAFSTQAVTA